MPFRKPHWHPLVGLLPEPHLAGSLPVLTRLELLSEENSDLIHRIGRGRRNLNFGGGSCLKSYRILPVLAVCLTPIYHQ